MLKVNELVYLYSLKASKEHGYYELVPWERKTRIVKGLPSSFRYWKSRFFFVSGDDFETSLSEIWDNLPRLHSQWGISTLVKRQPKLKRRYRERVQKAIEYEQTIENWDDLMDPKTLAFYCLGPEPSSFVLRNLDIEGKKKMMMKFNKDMYAKMRSKKGEPLSNIGKKMVRVTGKGTSISPAVQVTPITSGVEATRTVSSLTSIEELSTPAFKRPHLPKREKEKVVPRLSTIWDDKRLAVDRAHGAMATEDLKALSGVPFTSVASRHVQNLIQCWGKVSILPLST